MTLNVIWNTLSAVYYSSELNDEGIDKPASVVHEIGHVAIVLLEMNLV